MGKINLADFMPIAQAAVLRRYEYRNDIFLYERQISLPRHIGDRFDCKFAFMVEKTAKGTRFLVLPGSLNDPNTRVVQKDQLGKGRVGVQAVNLQRTLAEHGVPIPAIYIAEYNAEHNVYVCTYDPTRQLTTPKRESKKKTQPASLLNSSDPISAHQIASMMPRQRGG